MAEIILRARDVPPDLLEFFEPVIESRQSSVIKIPTEPTPFAHFATMPTALADRCIRAGTSAYGVCSVCQAPYARILERIKGTVTSYNGSSFTRGKTHDARAPLAAVGQHARTAAVQTHGWQPTCACPASSPVPATVLDPFTGSSTTLLAARALGRHGVGLDLSWPYLATIARQRLGLTALDAWEHGEAPRPLQTEGLPLFDLAALPENGAHHG